VRFAVTLVEGTQRDYLLAVVGGWFARNARPVNAQLQAL